MQIIWRNCHSIRTPVMPFGSLIASLLLSKYECAYNTLNPSALLHQSSRSGEEFGWTAEAWRNHAVQRLWQI